ncbi:hypothetical protein FB567DRAFT_328739 [Paraphoma chrysanthemicola]|uniref:Cyclase n=1 Tax=Paraphoma chrysanthemicola TaxID=798071 RepID=A0A8K0RBC2_9PLEO|nr:hypothetical protein FB567DRAFT_328739 [Paraphoma chrysanthemicola]
MESKALPAFIELPLREGDPPYSAWGLWGPDNEIGTLNHITPETVKRAAQEIRHGKRFSLNWPLTTPKTPGIGRHNYPFSHVLHCDTPGLVFDDSITFNTQISSQWDGLRHFAYQATQQFYNGITKASITAPGSSVIGLQNVATQGNIAARGVLIDYYSYVSSLGGKEYDPTDHHAITYDDLMACIAYQEKKSGEKIEFLPGDILVIRCGYTKHYTALSASDEVELGKRMDLITTGVQQDVRTLQWMWENRFAAVGGDSPSFEAFPPNVEAGFVYHEVLLAGWGCMIGEMWDLEALAEWCKEEERWSFFLASVPLNVVGGVGSPANVMAIV